MVHLISVTEGTRNFEISVGEMDAVSLISAITIKPKPSATPGGSILKLRFRNSKGDEYVEIVNLVILPSV